MHFIHLSISRRVAWLKLGSSCHCTKQPWRYPYGDIIMGAISSQITSLTIVNSTVYSNADKRKHQSSASLAFVRGIHRGPVNSPHKWPVTRMFPFDDVIMWIISTCTKPHPNYQITIRVDISWDILYRQHHSVIHAVSSVYDSNGLP